MSDLRARIRRQEQLRGVFASIPSPVAVEILCQARPDFICIDCEHSFIAGELLENMIRAAALHAVPVLVRVAENDGAEIAGALDSGAVGVLVPRVSSRAEAERCVSAARHAPEGRRGAGPGRASNYGADIPGAVAKALRETVVIAQLETPEAVEAAAEILSVPGLDLGFVGPGDLGLSLKAANSKASLDAAIDCILDAARASEKPAGIFSMSREDSEAWLKRVNFVIQQSDTMLLAHAAQYALKAL
ncbi:HpcH/HpaI aldolase/citrate lyase family protein [Tropicimonas sp. IMCC34011]|uniref:HpcH/HpaI aldolase family protein n=1 Tax=Tropicimonas sp. IMCC34011 TaxID=2248759 RepID=UPI000E25A8A0|nr:aldolase/citrate lyase family protein [Tropicimonas sp. IMCC34011]